MKQKREILHWEHNPVFAERPEIPQTRKMRNAYWQELRTPRRFDRGIRLRLKRAGRRYDPVYGFGDGATEKDRLKIQAQIRERKLAKFC